MEDAPVLIDKRDLAQLRLCRYLLVVALILAVVLVTAMTYKQPIIKEVEAAVPVLRTDPHKYLPYILSRSKALNSRLYAKLASDISASIIFNCEKYKLPPALILGIMETESEFKPWAVSNKNARGLMQINMAANAAILSEIISEEEVFCPEKNIEAGCFLLHSYLEEKKSLDGALDTYLGADVKAYKDGILRNMGRVMLWEAK